MKINKAVITLTFFCIFLISFGQKQIVTTSLKNNERSNLDLKNQGYQIFQKDNFIIKCNSKLKSNTILMKMAKEQGNKYPITSYIATEYKDSYDKAVIYTVQITDITLEYKGISANKQNDFTNKYLDNYCLSLKANNMSYSKLNFIGLNSVEYSFLQNGSLPCKAIIFIKDKKAFLLQVGTRKDLSKKYANLKTSFKFIK
jgi:hypothetical protein